MRMLSSVWLEHLPYKQRVIGSTPITPTKQKTLQNQLQGLFLFIFGLIMIKKQKHNGEYLLYINVFPDFIIITRKSFQ